LTNTLTLLLTALFAGGNEFNQRRLKPIAMMINTIRLIESIGDGEIDGNGIADQALIGNMRGYSIKSGEFDFGLVTTAFSQFSYGETAEPCVVFDYNDRLSDQSTNECIVLHDILL
jgi:hypothetical protein